MAIRLKLVDDEVEEKKELDFRFVIYLPDGTINGVQMGSWDCLIKSLKQSSLRQKYISPIYDRDEKAFVLACAKVKKNNTQNHKFFDINLIVDDFGQEKIVIFNQSKSYHINNSHLV